jgi:uncharacterized protein
MDTKQDQITSEIKKYVQFVATQLKIEKIILFGSYAKGYATSESDIDIAVVSPQFGKAPILEKMKLFRWRRHAGVDVMLDIRPIPIGLYEYESGSNFFIQEIKNTGIDITKEVS